jgi:hypothetical protein
VNQFGKAQPKQSPYDTSTPYGQPTNWAQSRDWNSQASKPIYGDGSMGQTQRQPAFGPSPPQAAYLPAVPIANFRPQGPSYLPFPANPGGSSYPVAQNPTQGAYVRPGTVPGNTQPQAPMDEAQFYKRQRRGYANADHEVDPFATYQDYVAAFSAGQQQPAIDPVKAWEAYDRAIAGQRRPLPGGGQVMDFSNIVRPPMARPGSAPSPYSNQAEYQRFMRANYPGWHTDRTLQKMVPWEFNPANPDRGEQRTESMNALAAFSAAQPR